MSDNPTQAVPDSRSFEDRVFARFDSLGARIDRFESRVEAKVDALDGRLTTLGEKVDNPHIRANQRELNQRIEKLESQSTR
ncbi:MAG: hypothetical protein ABW208_19390 [Pyrinomonadaceae bacterium]